MNPPVYSVIIPSYRSKATIQACLTALLQQDCAQPFEIIVVDSSPDETPELVRRAFPQVTLIHLPQQTDPAQARNIGAEHALGEVLAFIDSDCVARSDWLHRLATILAQGYDGVGGAIANGNGESLVSWAGYMCEFREFLPHTPARDVENLTLGNVAYRRTAFWSVGGFPVGRFPQEDQVFHRALRAHGGRLRFDPAIVVAHTHRTQARAFLRHQRRIGQANARVLREIDHPGTTLARRPSLALLAMPALIPFRFARTVWACRAVAQGMALRNPLLAGLCLLGMCFWGWGFLEEAGSQDAEG